MSPCRASSEPQAAPASRASASGSLLLRAIWRASAVAWENYRSRWNIALGMPAAGFSEGAYCAVPERP